MKTYYVLVFGIILLVASSCANTKNNPPNEFTADLVLKNGIIYGDTSAQAVAVSNGEILFIGTDDEITNYIGNTTKVVDLHGKMAVPGFIDNHIHIGEGGEVTCEPDNDLNLEEQADELAGCADQVDKGEWIIGYGLYLETVLGEEGSYLEYPLYMLDEIFPENPVIIMEQTSHSMFVNSLALEAVGITKDTPDPQGGIIMKDEAGELLGVLIDNAGDIVMEEAVNRVHNKFDLFYEGILYGLEEAAKNGITTVGDGRTYWKRGLYEAWKAIEEDGELIVRVSLRPWIYPEAEKGEQIQFLEKVYQNDINKRLIVNQVKMYIDGTVENFTARVLKPYPESYFPQYPYGINYIPQKEMEEWLVDLYVMGYGAHIHAIGDGGVREALNAVASVRERGSRLQYNMTHLLMMDKEDISRFAKLDVDADIQIDSAAHSHEEIMAEYVPYIGEMRAEEITYRPLKELAESGANVVLSSDWTVNPISPMYAISHSVASGSLDIHGAIAAYTINPAKALGLDEITGSIEVGKSADFAVLSEDLTTLEPEDILDVEVEMTILEGDIVFEKGQ